MNRLKLEGLKRGRLTFLKINSIKNKTTYWNCLCDCGNKTIVQGCSKTRSCGCLAIEAKSINGQKNKNQQTAIEFIKDRIEIDKQTECWNWTKSLIGQYARISGIRSKKSIIASRYVYEYIVGIDPKEKLVCHKCDNPKCVNPNHLFLGTHIDNLKDMRDKNRAACGIKNFKAKLTEKEVLQIRRIKNKLTLQELAEIYKVTISTIRRVIQRETWTHI